MAYCEANLISLLHKDVCIICLQIKLKVEENVETNFTFFLPEMSDRVAILKFGFKPHLYLKNTGLL